MQQLHKKRIKHGKIDFESVYTKKRSKGFEIKLGGFDLAQVLRKPTLNPYSNANTKKIETKINRESDAALMS